MPAFGYESGTEAGNTHQIEQSWMNLEDQILFTNCVKINIV